MADRAHYRCPVEGCGEEIESTLVVDPDFAARMDAHIAAHRASEFHLSLSLVSVAMQKPDAIAAALRAAARDVQSGRGAGVVIDAGGNTVGTWAVVS